MPQQQRKSDQDNKPVAVRLPDVARHQLDDLMTQWGENQTQVLLRCLERAWTQEIDSTRYLVNQEWAKVDGSGTLPSL